MWRQHRNIAALRAMRNQDAKVFAPPQDRTQVFAPPQDRTKDAKAFATLQDRDDEDDVPDPLYERYAIGPLIGRGTFGKVYRGQSRISGAAVAMKFASVDQDPEVAIREVNLLNSLQHDCIVPLLDYFGPEPSCRSETEVFVYPWREGDLQGFICRRESDAIQQSVTGLSVTGGPRPLLDRSTVESWASQLASGLAFMHSRNTVHRDLKPGNILLVWQGAGMRVEIADLGAARLVPLKKRRLNSKSTVDTTAQFADLTPNVMTEPYSAPEAWFEGDYGYPIDIWSFGAIVFELLTFQMFTPGRKAVDRVVSALSRLDCQEEAESHILGPLQPPMVTAAVQALSEGGGLSVPSLAACAASAPPRGMWDLVVAALIWRPEARITAKALSERLPRLDIAERARGITDAQPAAGLCATAGPAAKFPAGLPAEPSRAESTKSLAGPVSMDFALTPRCTPITRQGIAFCKCSGHCNMKGHRYRSSLPGTQVCTCTSLVEDTDFCVGCKCSIAKCSRPRHKGDLCYRHGRGLAKLPWRFQAMRAARDILQRMTPCDVIAFVEVFGQLKMSLCSTVLAAWLKDPAAVKAFVVAASASPRGMHCEASADDVFDALVKMLKEVDGPSNTVELEQTARQGVARFMGARIVCRVLKVVAESPEEVGLCEDAPERVALGLGADKFYVAQGCPDELRSFVTACNAFDPKFRKLLCDTDVSCQGVISFANGMHQLLEKVLSESPPCKTRFKGYTGRNMVRKITVSWIRACLCDTAGRAVDLRWSEVDYNAIEEAGAVAYVNGKARNDVATACGNIAAADLSELLLGRQDHALFVSMWACLFSEVAQKRDGKTQNRIIGLLSSPCAAEVLDAFLLQHGFPPCPEVLVRLLLRK